MSIDYQGIIKEIKDDEIIKLMKSLGADRYEEREDSILFPTICHNINSIDASLKLYFYRDTKLFMCYTECGGMNIFKFLETYYKTRNIEYNWYTDILDVITNISSFSPKEEFYIPYRERLTEKYRKKNQTKKLQIFDDCALDVFIKKYPIEWLNDGITKAAMDKFNILFSISQNKIIIPHYDINNNLIGIRGRSLNKWEIENIGKYMPIQIEQTRYSHPLSLNLYGLNINKENIKETGVVFLFEAEKSVLQVENFNMINCSVAVCGSNFNKFQLNILLKECHPKEIVICFDKEADNDKETYFDKLYSIGEKYKQYCNFSFIYDMERLLNMKDSPSDKGELVFKKLLEKRVVVR